MRGSLTLSWGGSLLALQCSLLVPLFALSEISSSCELLPKSMHMAGGFEISFNLIRVEKSKYMDLAYKEYTHCHEFVQERFDSK